MNTLNNVKKIEMNVGEQYSIKIGDLYDYINQEGGTFEILTPTGFEKIGDIYNKTNKKIYKLELENGLSLTGSEDHLVLVDTTKNLVDDEVNDNVEIIDNNTWIRIPNLINTDWVKIENGTSKVKSIEFIGINDTYDLEVLTDEHSYISNGIISHNTGKTSLADGLALAISQKRVSRLLFDKRIVSLDVGSIVSGTKYRGMMEERIKSIIAELEVNKDVILFIDEIHTIIGAGGSAGSLDISNMFKPALARGEIQVIGATTLDEYRKHIEKDGALERRFQKVIVEPSTEEESIIILNNIKNNYEDFHNVYYSPEAIEACVKLTSRYLPDRHLPDKAIDAMDEVGSRIHISKISVPKEILDIEQKIVETNIQKNEVVKKQKYEDAAKLRDKEKTLERELEEAKERWEEEQLKNRQLVTEHDVAEVVSQMSGIPLTKVTVSENKRLKNMFNELSGKVIGQDEALSKIVKAIQRAKMGMKDPNRPLLTSLMVGDSGVGKCISKDTFITLRNKKTGKVEKLRVSDLIN